MKLFIAVPQITPPETIQAMRKAAQAAGFTAVFAQDVALKNPRGTTNERKLANFYAVCRAMKECDAMMANLTPYLGVEPDPDVIFQLGYMTAQQKPVFSYTNVSKPFYDRVEEWNGGKFATDQVTGASGNVAVLKRDRDNMRSENMGIKDRDPVLAEADQPDNYNNLMLEGPSMLTGSKVLTPSLVRTHVPEASLYSDLSVFAASLAEARQHLVVEGRTKAAAAPKKSEDSLGIYLAGPDVFLPNLDQHFEDKKLVLTDCKLNGVAPTDAQMDFGLMQTWARANGNNPKMREAIFKADTGVMQSVRGGIFNLTPHHGVAGDSGTIFEMGYMTGKDDKLGRRPMVFGYSNDGYGLKGRIAQWKRNPQGPAYGAEKAAAVTAPDTVFSSMIDGAMLASGGTLNNRLDHAKSKYLNLQQDQVFSHLSEFIHAAHEARRMCRINSILQRSSQLAVG